MPTLDERYPDLMTPRTDLKTARFVDGLDTFCAETTPPPHLRAVIEQALDARVTQRRHDAARPRVVPFSKLSRPLSMAAVAALIVALFTLLALSIGALTWGERSSGRSTMHTLHLSAALTSLIPTDAQGRVFAWSALMGRLFVLDDRIPSVVEVQPAPLLIERAITVPAIGASISPQTADGQIFFTDALLARHVYAAGVGGGPPRVVATPLREQAPSPYLSPYLAADAIGHRLFVLTDAAPEGRLSAYDTRTLRLLWTVSLPSVGAPATSSTRSITEVPLVVDGPDARVIVGHLHEPAVSIIAVTQGRLIGTLPLGPALLPGANDAVPSIVLDTHAHRAYALLTNTGTVTTLDPLHVRVVKTVNVGVTPALPVVDARTGRVVVTSLGMVRVLDGQSGLLVRTTVSTQTISSYPVAVDTRSGLIFAAGFNGQTVDVFDGLSGRLQRSIPLPGVPEALAVDAATQRLLVVVHRPSVRSRGTNDGAAVLCVLESGTGRLRHTLSLGPGMGVHLSLDERTHHALVLLRRLSSTSSFYGATDIVVVDTVGLL